MWGYMWEVWAEAPVSEMDIVESKLFSGDSWEMYEKYEKNETE